MLGTLVFADVTLLGVQDIDFFAADRSTNNGKGGKVYHTATLSRRKRRWTWM